MMMMLLAITNAGRTCVVERASTILKSMMKIRHSLNKNVVLLMEMMTSMAKMTMINWRIVLEKSMMTLSSFQRTHQKLEEPRNFLMDKLFQKQLKNMKMIMSQRKNKWSLLKKALKNLSIKVQQNNLPR
jgi:hypothetical protein